MKGRADVAQARGASSEFGENSLGLLHYLSITHVAADTAGKARPGLW